MIKNERRKFRETCVGRDRGLCIIPWCDREVTSDPKGPGEVHHILERNLWDDGGYIPDNGVCVCNYHHRMSEDNEIPPQAYWRWIGVEDPPLPQGLDSMHIDKWGSEFEKPPWTDFRDYSKYPSTRHFPFSHVGDYDDTSFEEVGSFTDISLIITVKMDGSNSMLVKDSEEPVRARNAKDAEHESFDMLKQLYWDKNIYEKIPEYIQVFGEWIYAKHSIHYGCDCEDPCEDIGPALDSYFQIFGIFDTRYHLWLSWPEVRSWSDKLDFPTVPVAEQASFDNSAEVYSLVDVAKDIISKGHEGIVARTKYPFHYGQFRKKVGKYVRKNHVKTDQHWSRKKIIKNHLKGGVRQ